jgi:hypothetical protein
VNEREARDWGNPTCARCDHVCTRAGVMPLPFAEVLCPECDEKEEFGTAPPSERAATGKALRLVSERPRDGGDEAA